jgi:hypothetical protein
LPVFRVYTPETYDYHISHPIVLDDEYDSAKEEDTGYEIVDMKTEPKHFQIDGIETN